MTLKELAAIIEAVDYKPGWFVRFGEQAGGFFVQWRFFAPDHTSDGDMQEWGGRKWYVSQHATRSEVVQTLLKAALAAEEHEAREQFLYKGVAVFQPHLDVDALLAARIGEDKRVPA